MSTISLAVNGAAGRMGQLLVRHIRQAEDLQLVAALEAEAHPALGSDAGVVAGLPKMGLPISTALGEVRPAVVIDFSVPESTVRMAAACRAAHIGLLVGTTGLTEQELEPLRAAATQIPVMVSPNMSVGVNLLFSLVQQVAECLGQGYDIEIIEMHHRHKKDAPSGTACRIAERAAEGLGRPLSEVAIYGRYGIGPERPAGQIAVHTVRGGDVAGDHQVIFAGEGERIELIHRASSRDVFVVGALRAARFLAKQPAGWYQMEQVLGL